MQLTEQEKDQLYSIIAAFIGEGSAILAARPRFTEQTVSVVEEMLATNMNCNASMKSLVSEMLSGGRVLATGWLKRVLGAASKAVKNSTLSGYGCLVTTKSRWKTEILVSAM